MFLKISDYLRRYSEEIEENTPVVAERNKTDINGNPLPEETPLELSESVSIDPESKGITGRPGAPRKPGTYQENPKPTAAPRQRAPRREPAHRREWNPNDRRQKMREYMSKYRGTGRINERKTQTRGE